MNTSTQFKQLPEPWHMYEVNESGIVRRIATGAEMKVSKNNSGYLQVGVNAYPKSLYPDPYIKPHSSDRIRRGNTVHRLVALAWLPKPLPGQEIDHRDGDKTNNHYTNLRWVTKSQNNKLRRSYPRTRGFIIRTNLVTGLREYFGAHQFREYERVLQRMRAEKTNIINHHGYEYLRVVGKQVKTFLRELKT